MQAFTRNKPGRSANSDGSGASGDLLSSDCPTLYSRMHLPTLGLAEPRGHFVSKEGNLGP